jgi:hypothetical protein
MKKRGRGRPPETWKHEIYALILEALGHGTQQDPSRQAAHFDNALSRILYGDPKGVAGSPWPDSLFPMRLGLVEAAITLGESASTVRRLAHVVKTVEANSPRAMALLAQLLRLRSRQMTRWEVEERANLAKGVTIDGTYYPSLMTDLEAPKNEPRQPCTCVACREDARAAMRLRSLVPAGLPATVLRSAAGAEHCVRGGPGLSTWERGAFRVACLLLGDESAPKNFKVMQEKGRSQR